MEKKFDDEIAKKNAELKAKNGELIHAINSANSANTAYSEEKKKGIQKDNENSALSKQVRLQTDTIKKLDQNNEKLKSDLKIEQNESCRKRCNDLIKTRKVAIELKDGILGRNKEKLAYVRQALSIAGDLENESCTCSVTRQMIIEDFPKYITILKKDN
jgi:hypothetical protein